MTNNPFKQDTLEAILWEFLSYPLNTAEGILDRFAELPGAIRKKGKEPLEEFVYIRGTREDRATLIAHADTYFAFSGEHKMIYEDGIIKSDEPNDGIGADDRAGCAMLWLLKDLGHNLLIIDGEESGGIGASYLKKHHQEILQEVQNSSFMLEFDRKTALAYAKYDLPVTKKFIEYLEKETGYKDDGGGFTDICVIGHEGCCSANVSVSYYNHHTSKEYINVKEWLNNYEIYKKMLSKPLTRYELVK